MNIQLTLSARLAEAAAWTNRNPWAIRLAVIGFALALALAGSGPAFAGDCPGTGGGSGCGGG